MASKGYVRKSTIADAKWLAPRLRKEDRLECITITGKAPGQILPGSVALATSAYTMFSPTGTPVGLFGCSRTGRPGVGSVWLMATDELPQYARQFLRESREWVKVLHEHYPTLWNVVDTRNTVHLRWVSWCGFQFGKVHLIGPERVPFLEFSKVK